MASFKKIKIKMYQTVAENLGRTGASQASTQEGGITPEAVHPRRPDGSDLRVQSGVAQDMMETSFDFFFFKVRDVYCAEVDMVQIRYI